MCLQSHPRLCSNLPPPPPPPPPESHAIVCELAHHARAWGCGVGGQASRLVPLDILLSTNEAHDARASAVFSNLWKALSLTTCSFKNAYAIVELRHSNGGGKIARWIFGQLEREGEGPDSSRHCTFLALSRESKSSDRSCGTGGIVRG